MKVAMVIPARQTGPLGRFPGKLTATLNDRTLISIALDCAISARAMLQMDCDVIVSTDDADVIGTVNKYAERISGIVALQRPQWLCLPGSTAVTAVAHAVAGESVDYAVQLNATSPLRSPALVAACIHDAIRGQVEYLASVRRSIDHALNIDDMCDVSPYHRPRTQDIPPQWVETGEVFVYDIDSLSTWSPPENYNRTLSPGPHCDIDTKWDLKHAQAMLDFGLAKLPKEVL